MGSEGQDAGGPPTLVTFGEEDMGGQPPPRLFEGASKGMGPPQAVAGRLLAPHTNDTRTRPTVAPTISTPPAHRAPKGRAWADLAGNSNESSRKTMFAGGKPRRIHRSAV